MIKNISVFILCLGFVGCSSVKKAESKRNLSSSELPQCSETCSTDQVCMNTFTSAGAKCAPVPQEAPIVFDLPVDSNTEVVCTHSSGSTSHSGANAFFALDLATEYSKPPSIIRASADGVAYVFGSNENGEPCSSDPNVICNLCPEPAGTPAKSEVSDCGQSWGNHIRILHENGYISFYVHLNRPLIRTGTYVKKGDPIGIEGSTGAAGHRHLHWSIQKLPGSNESDWITRISWAGQSVPFKFQAVQNGRLNTFDVKNVICAHAGIGQAPPEQQPRFKGPTN